MRSSYTIEHLQILDQELPALIDVHQVPRHASPILRTLDRATAVEYIATVALGMVSAFSSKVDVELPQCRLWATIVYEDYSDLRVAEIKIILKNAMKQKLYGAVDVNTMLVWVADYYPQRAGVMADFFEQRHHQKKEIIEGGPCYPPPAIAEAMRAQERQLLIDNVGSKIPAPSATKQKKRRTYEEKVKEFAKARSFLLENIQK